MFFLTYLRLELRHRMRQAVVIAARLAVGVALVKYQVTVASRRHPFQKNHRPQSTSLQPQLGIIT